MSSDLHPLARRFQYVLFDLGSTLIYFQGKWPCVLNDGVQAATRYLHMQGYRLNSLTFPKAYLDLMQEYYQKRSDEELEYPALNVLAEALKLHGCAEAFQEHHLRQALNAFYAVSQAHWFVETDAAPVLKELQESGCRLGIVSNASDDDDVQVLVDKAGLRRYFDFILTSAEAGYRKPSPVIFQKALAFWEARPEQAVMIGDTIAADIVGARRSNLSSVWITRRADTPENRLAAQQDPPDQTIDTLSELPALLARW